MDRKLSTCLCNQSGLTRIAILASWREKGQWLHAGHATQVDSRHDESNGPTPADVASGVSTKLDPLNLEDDCIGELLHKCIDNRRLRYGTSSARLSVDDGD